MLKVVGRGSEAQRPGENVAKRRKYDFEVQQEKVHKYHCSECNETVEGHEKYEACAVGER